MATGQSTNFSANGIGDLRVGLKYNMLPTLRSMVVLGFGVYLPSGNTHAHDSAKRCDGVDPPNSVEGQSD